MKGTFNQQSSEEANLLPINCEVAHGIFYALEDAGKIVHISAVEKGLKCKCFCPECGKPLVAKKGRIKIPHFAHAAHSSCGGGVETALHLFAKQIIEKRLTLLLPELVAQYGSVRKVLRQAGEYTFDRAVCEQPLKNTSQIDQKPLIPDIFLWKRDRCVMVEIHVTHPCGVDKIARLKDQGIASIEINLSTLARNASPDAIEKAVISMAPRKWIFHEKIESAVAIMKTQVEKIENIEIERRKRELQKFEAEIDNLQKKLPF